MGSVYNREGFYESGLSEADRKKLLRGYQMDPIFLLAPGKISDADSKKLSASAEEKQTIEFKQCTLLRDIVRAYVHAIDRVSQGLAKFCELENQMTWTGSSCRHSTLRLLT